MRIQRELSRDQLQPCRPLSRRLPVLPLDVGLGRAPNRCRLSRGRRSCRGVTGRPGQDGARPVADKRLGPVAGLLEETRISVGCADRVSSRDALTSATP